jgi:hypothetical protein
VESKNYEEVFSSNVPISTIQVRLICVNTGILYLSDAVLVFPDISLQLQNGMSDSLLSRGYELYTQLPKRPFLVDGVSEELVPVMSYTAIFRFAYIRRLHARALEFPLDVSLAYIQDFYNNSGMLSGGMQFCWTVL